jgi:hypothetical protein
MRKGIKKFLMVAILACALTCVFAFVVNTPKSEAASGRDCDTNSIDRAPNHGGCGAADSRELVADARTNQPADLQRIYAHFGLTADKYDRFASTAKQGTVFRDGRVVVDGQTVMTDARSYGREKFNGQRTPINIGGTTYYSSFMQFSFGSGTNSLPAMVMFDDQGAPEVIIMNPCGNPITGTPVKPAFACKQLNMESKGNDTYSFNSEVTFSGNAQLEKVVYNFGDNSPEVSKTNPAEVVTHKFTESSTITVTAHFLLPGGKRAAVTANDCMKKVVVTPPEQPQPPEQPTPPAPTTPTPPPALPNTGVGDILGIFAATAVGGVIAHRFVWSRRFAR